jgi:hypothetical protein
VTKGPYHGSQRWFQAEGLTTDTAHAKQQYETSRT